VTCDPKPVVNVRSNAGLHGLWQFCRPFLPHGLPGQLTKRTLQFIVRHAIDFSGSDEATAYGFVDGELQLAPVHVSAAQKIHDGSQRTRHADPLHFLNFAGVEVCPVKDRDLRNRAVAAKFSRHGHMQLRRHDVR
jgi:hypothetical protein